MENLLGELSQKMRRNSGKLRQNHARVLQYNFSKMIMMKHSGLVCVHTG